MKKSKGAFLAAGFLLCLCVVGCGARTPHSAVAVNGLATGIDTTDPVPMKLKIGESLADFLTDNPAIGNLWGQDAGTPIGFPIMRRTHVNYDDGSIKLDADCVFTTNISANADAPGISTIGLHLCEPSRDNWEEATRRAHQLILSFEKRNPGLLSLSGYLKNNSRESAEKKWKIGLIDKWTRAHFPLTEAQANSHFKNAADEGHVQQLQYNQGSTVLMSAYANDRTLVYFEIAKESYWGGAITRAQAHEMKYQIVISFAAAR